MKLQTKKKSFLYHLKFFFIIIIKISFEDFYYKKTPERFLQVIFKKLNFYGANLQTFLTFFYIFESQKYNTKLFFFK